MVTGGDIVTRFEKDKEVLLDLLAESIGIGIGDNKLYFCNEIDCEDCLIRATCLLSGKAATLKTHKWIDENFEKQHKDIMDYLCLDFAVDINWGNEYDHCKNILCSDCLFEGHKACTKAKEEWLKEEA